MKILTKFISKVGPRYGNHKQHLVENAFSKEIYRVHFNMNILDIARILNRITLK